MSAWVQITSGQGPAECCWVVARLAEVIQNEAAQAGLQVKLLETIPGDEPATLKSVLLALDGDGTAAFVAGWSGTVQWTGRSPFRPHHKRKNWFVGVECFSPPKAPRWSEREM